MNDLEKAEIKQNKAIRGYIIRCLVKGYNNTALTRQLSNAAMKCSRYMELIEGSPGMKENIQRTSAQG